MIKTYGLCKNYGEKRALDCVNLEFQPGKIYGVLGRNGAGKTTLVNIITNRAIATSGYATIDNDASYENDRALEKVFCITEKSAYPTSEKVSNLFKWAARFYKDFDFDYAYELSKKFDLETDKKLGKLSTGYTTIAKVVLTLASNAPYMIFDEPVLGIDAIYREIFYEELIKAHKRLGNCMILASHILDESERVIDDVIVLREGRVVHNSPITDITATQSLQAFYLDLHKSSDITTVKNSDASCVTEDNGSAPTKLHTHGAIEAKKLKYSALYLLYITWIHAVIVTLLCVFFTVIPLIIPEVDMSIEISILINVLILAMTVHGFYFRYALYNGVSRRTYVVSVAFMLLGYSIWFAILSSTTMLIYNLNGYEGGLLQMLYATDYNMSVALMFFAFLFTSILLAVTLGFFSIVLYNTLSRKARYIAMIILMLILILFIIWSSLSPKSLADTFIFLLGLKYPSSGGWIAAAWFTVIGAIFGTASWLILRRSEVK